MSEQEEFTDFKNPDALFWRQAHIEYGDWEKGPDNDGSYTKIGKINTPEVCQYFYQLCSYKVSEIRFDIR